MSESTTERTLRLIREEWVGIERNRILQAIQGIPLAMRTIDNISAIINDEPMPIDSPGICATTRQK